MTLVLSDPSDLNGTHDASPQERRRGLRVRRARPVRAYDPTSARHFGGETEDISATGLRIVLPASALLRPGKTITVHVGLGSDGGAALANRRQMMPARVIWIDRGQSMEFLVAGIEFLASISAHLDAA